MNFNVLTAVFRRNFGSYFASPTGYLFICVFVLMGAIAAFWVPAFFNNNLANLDQLSFWFPFIMLVYVPSITMGVWADERKQGTDELLLTIPAGDFEIVLGKYLSAVAIFSVALLFSLVCNLAVLAWLGNPDVGLFLGTYVGYWLVGLAMLAIGLVASFLTANITISFVLGVLFNIPLVALAQTDAMLGGLGRQATMAVKSWSIGSRMDDFAHGVISLASVVYFLVIVVVMLYLSMVLIGRRHWFSGLHRWEQAGHYLVRALSLVVIASATVVFFRHHDLRCDATYEKLSSLSKPTRELLHDLKVERPVRIEAYVSPVVPESYVQTRLNLLSALRELQAWGGNNLEVEIHATERFSKEAALAEERFGIEPHEVTTLSHGALAVDYIFLDVAIKCGAGEPLVQYFDRGIPAEYELIRSICTVAQQERKKIGVLETDAKLFGGFNMQSMSADPDWPIVDELKKQYEVVRVDPTKPISDRYDVLLAVQPSSLDPEAMKNFIAAVRGGQATAIFEDPAPVFCPSVPGTGAPRMPPGGMNAMFMPRQPLPKGDIKPLWSLLGVRFPADLIVWQDYNPFPKFSQFPTEFIFIDNACHGPQPVDLKGGNEVSREENNKSSEYDGFRPFNQDDPISAGLQLMLFPFPGYLAESGSADLEFIPLVRTGEQTGTVLFSEIMQMTPFGPRGGLNPNRRQIPTGESYVEAARIRGKIALDPPAEPEKPDAAEEAKAAEPREVEIDVVLAPDIDMISRDFFRLREQGNVPEAGVHFDFDNVTFVLNALDSLAGDPRFIEIRKRRPVHRTLTRIEDRTKEARKEAADARKKFTEEYERLKTQEEEAMQKTLAELKNQKNIDLQHLAIVVGMKQQELERKMEAKLEQARREKDREINRSETELNLEIKRVQDQYKLWAVLLPPIPPLLVAVFVFFSRRAREREGVARARLR
ncbi:MAG: Gldg family protein [Pirellulales bacterium]|nr:Gldg family protein [Pirellulales bacterium]